MKALVLVGAGELVVKKLPKPLIKADEVLIKVSACGVCGSDIPRVKEAAVKKLPLVLGHEFAGTIVEVGENISQMEIGKRVALAPLLPCNHCRQCMGGYPAMCPNYSFIGSRVNGAMAEYIALPHQNIVEIGEKTTFEQAAFIEPLTVAIHAVERINLQIGKKALVYGCGTIGLLIIQVLKAKGITDITAVDISNSKLAFAEQSGATRIINNSQDDIGQQLGSVEMDYIFESTGASVVQAKVFDFSAPHGSVVFVGTVHQPITYSPAAFETILRKELIVTGSWMSYSGPFPGLEWSGASALLAGGQIKVDSYITHRPTLEDGLETIEKLWLGDEDILKIMFKF